MTKQRLEPARTRKRKVLVTELKGRLSMIPVVEIKNKEKKASVKYFLKSESQCKQISDEQNIKILNKDRIRMTDFFSFLPQAPM